MSNRDKIGKTFSTFFVNRLFEQFDKMPRDIKLEFSGKRASEEQIICTGLKENWPDSRLTDAGNSGGCVWRFTGHCLGSAQERFFRMIIEELERRFSDLIYLETVEKCIGENKLGRNGLADVFIGELLNREWLLEQYVKRILKEEYLPELEFLIQLSAQKYEQRSIKTNMYFCDLSFFPQKDVIIFRHNEAIRLSETRNAPGRLRTVRKLMEMSGEKHGLIIHRTRKDQTIVGIAEDEKYVELSSVQIQFTGHLSWAVMKNKQVLFAYQEGMITIPDFDGDGNDTVWKEKLAELKQKFPDIGGGKNFEQTVENIVQGLKERQNHGTSIVFMDENMLEKEKRRLISYRRAYAIEPFSILEHLSEMSGIASIDGAIIADIDGRFHVVGAILDGESVVEGNSGRGARYNPLVNYVNWIYKKYTDTSEKIQKAWCFAVVLSEDGMVDLEMPL